MKIKTKRGARRIRNQRVITRRFVTTDYNGCSYITAGKRYEVTVPPSGELQGFNINNDNGVSIFTILAGSSHLNDEGVWQWGVI